MMVYINDHCESLMNLALQLNLKSLGIFCADYQIKMMVDKEEKYQLEYTENENQRLNEKR
jgi:hypothetical protein